MRRGRIWTWAKWACTAAAVALTAIAVLSHVYACSYVTKSGDMNTARRVLIARTHVLVQTVHPAPFWDAGLDFPSAGLGWYWVTCITGHWRCGFFEHQSDSTLSVGVNLLYPLLLSTLPAAFLWYKDRRRFGPDACKGCGYDRRDLPAEAKCPECGTVPARG
jgi:hypothetical protein